MTGTEGVYYDGKSSARRKVSLFFDGERLHVSGDGIDVSSPLAEIRISPQLGSIRRSLRFPDGARCEIEDSAILEALISRQGRGRLSPLLYRWESSLKLAFLALILTAAIFWGLVKFGIPVLARQAAFAIPPATEASLGKETMAVLDRLVMAPSRLPEERRRQLRKRFQQVAADMPDGRSLRLEFRTGERIGANAFALPSGIIVVTDDLVRIARRDEEIMAVFAHEMGHVRYRHAVRHVLQNSATGLIVATVTGDVLSATSLSATLPTALIDAGFSREFETEADDAAVEYLTKHRIPLSCYADILARLQDEHDKGTDKNAKPREKRVADFLSTHPATRERIARFMGRRESHKR
ncbi:MAG: M48 family [Geobacteraceae bacterium]|nr:MAG: M48 family [Geobacteraceae bacterium]